MMDALIESCVKRKHQQRDQSARDGISVPDGAGKKFRNGKTLSISVYKHRLRKKVLENQLCETYTVSIQQLQGQQAVLYGQTLILNLCFDVF